MWLQKSQRGNLYIHKGRVPGTTEHDVPHVLVKKDPFRYLPHLKSKKLCIYVIVLILVAEICSLSKYGSLSKYIVVYSKLSKV